MTSPPSTSHAGLRRAVPSLLVWWVWKSAMALLVGAPLAAFVAGQTQHLPRGDAVLFDGGGVYLAELIRLQHDNLEHIVWGSLWPLLLAMVLGELPLAATVRSLAGKETLIQAYSASCRCLPKLWLGGGISLLARGLTAAILVAAGGLAFSWLANLQDERLADLLLAGGIAIGLVPMILLSALHDLWRISLVGGNGSVAHALGVAFHTCQRRSLRVFASFVAPLVTGAIVVLVIASISGWLDVASRPSAVALVVVLHQATLLGLTCLRALWLKLGRDLLGSTGR